MWICIGTALGLHALGLHPTPENLEPYVALRPPCRSQPEHFASLGYLCRHLHRQELFRTLNNAVDTLRVLQILIDCNRDSTLEQQRASLLM